MDENKMWSWIQDTTRALSYRMINNKEEAEDVASDVIVRLLKDKKYAEKIYRYGQNKTEGYKYGNSGVLVKLIQQEYSYHRIGKYFDTSHDVGHVNAWRYSMIYMQIQDICKEYDIQPIPQNAYLIAYGTGIANIDIVEKILKTVIPVQVDIEKVNGNKADGTKI